MADESNTHWALIWRGNTGCGLEVDKAGKVIVAGRSALGKKLLLTISCPTCFRAAEACLYSVAKP